MIFSSPKRILLIKLRHHGDVLLCTPVARVLKQRFPGAEIDMLVYAETESMLSGNPDIATVHVLHRSKKGVRRPGSILRLAAALFVRSYDWVFHLSDQWQGALLAKCSGAPVRVGIDYPKRKNRYWRACFSALAPLAASNSIHTVEQNLRVLAPLEIDVEAAECRCVPPIREEDREAIMQLLQEKGVTQPFVVVHPVARWPFKCWEDERFGAVIQSLANEGWPVLLTCSPDLGEIQVLRAIQQHVDSPRVEALEGVLTIGQLAALIERCQLFIGVDSMPMHLAAACGKKTVALFGPSKINEWRPWQTPQRLLSAADYGSVIDPDSVDTRTNERFLKNIPIADVLLAARELLASP